MSSTGKCFDIGAATKQSLIEFENRQEEFGRIRNIPSREMDFLLDPRLLRDFSVDFSKKDAAGNGALMRLTPVPLFFYRYPDYAVEFSGVSGRITHGNPIAYDACRYYGALIVAALLGESKKDLLDDNFYSKHKDWFNNKPLHEDVMKIVGGSYKQKDGHKGGIRGKGYIIQAMEAALWAFFSDEDSFEKGVLDAVNLGDDTDTTAAIYGQLAGAYYGYQQLPKKWLKSMFAQKFILCLSKWIVYEGQRWDPKKSQNLPVRTPTRRLQSNTTNGSSTTQKPDSNMQKTASQSGQQTSTEKSSERVSKTKETPSSNGGSNRNNLSNQSNASNSPNSTQLQNDTNSSERKPSNFE
jgi:hypothetical protein